MLFPQTGRDGQFLCRNRKLGFTITELIIGFVIFAGVSIAAYKVFTVSTRKAQEAQQTAKMSRSVAQFAESLRHHVENTIQLPNGTSSFFQVKRPPRCIGLNDDGTPESDQMGWTLIPMPGKNVSTINVAAYNPKDPSAAVVDDSTKANDAVIMNYMPQDAVVNYLTIDGTNIGKSGDADPYPTIQNAPGDVIKVDTINGLQIGDYAVLSDSTSRDIIRITNIRQCSGGQPCYEISHSYSVSVFNVKMTHNYGADEDNKEAGIPSIYRVQMETFALDSNKNQLMSDNHLLDDDFNPTTKTFGTKGLKLKWTPIADNILQFQLIYLTKGDVETRTPQAGIPGRVYEDCPGSVDCGCENQLGLPNLNNIRVAIKYSKPNAKDPNAFDETSLAFNPLNLKTNLSSVKTTYPGCDTGDPLYTTLADGVTPNPACDSGKSKVCLCADRCPVADCKGYGGGGKGNHGGVGYGGGGSG